MKRVRIGHAAVLAAALLRPIPGAAAAGPGDVISLSLGRGPNGGTVLRVTFRNETGRPQCLPYNWGAGSRLRAVRGARPLQNRRDFEGRPIPGCEPLRPGQVLVAVYRLDEAFGPIRPGDRICYVIPWRPAGARSTGSTTRCAVVRSSQLNAKSPLAGSSRGFSVPVTQEKSYVPVTEQRVSAEWRYTLRPVRFGESALRVPSNPLCRLVG